MKVLTLIARMVTGIVFVFSGFVKGIDPLGTAYKLSDYFTAFKLGFLDDLALPLAIILCTVEFVAGLMLLTGALPRLASWMVALFMALFTPLTLVLALFNPVTDCGCFGDAIHLTNWQTFFKNMVLTLIVVFVFIRRDDTHGIMSVRNGIKSTSACIIVFLVFICFNLSYLPVIDFRPYKPGTNLPEAMAIPQGSPADEYDLKFIYEKNGVEKEFTLDNYPADDTLWKFVDQKSILISKGYTPPVHDFSLITSDGTDMTDVLLSDQGYTILMISRRLEKPDAKSLTEGFNLGRLLKEKNIGFYIVTSSNAEEAEKINPGFTILYGDETTLKTVIRSNPGYVMLHNGTVMAMWSHKGLPSPESFGTDLNSLAINSQYQKNTVLIIIITTLFILLTVSLTSRFRRID